MNCSVCGANTSRLLFNKNGYDIHECSKCGLQFVANQPTLAELEKHYDWTFFKGGAEKFGYLDYEAEKKSTGRNFAERIALIERHKSGGSILDVGCALGFFLAQLGPQWKKTGVELSEDAAKYARKELGLDVRQGELESLKLEAGAYDVITMWDVIEHARDPMKLLAEAYKLLKPGGLIVITTGDAKSLSARLTGKHWYLMIPPTHLYFFSPETLGRGLVKAGFSKPETHYYGKVVAFEEVFFRLSYIVKIPALRGLSERVAKSSLGGLCIPFNLFDIMTVVAQKP